MVLIDYNTIGTSTLCACAVSYIHGRQERAMLLLYLRVLLLARILVLSTAGSNSCAAAAAAFVFVRVFRRLEPPDRVHQPCMYVYYNKITIMMFYRVFVPRINTVTVDFKNYSSTEPNRAAVVEVCSASVVM